jgi:hypothetical protein
MIRSLASEGFFSANTNNQTRQKLKEAYDAEFLATIERAEKQIILAKHGRRLLGLLDDTPIVPGQDRAAYDGGAQARQILNDAEDDLREWQPETYDAVDAAQDVKGKGKDLTDDAVAPSSVPGTTESTVTNPTTADMSTST